MGLNEIEREMGEAQKRQKYQSVFILFAFLASSCPFIVFGVRKTQRKIGDC